jgi:hypothetical protein
MLNREYQIRATKQGLAAKHAGHDALRLPWAGIFEPWRPFVMVAAAAERPESAFRRRTAAKNCKKRSRQLPLFDGKLRGVQLALFSENDVQKPRETSADSAFPPLAGMVDPMAEILTEDELAAEFEKLFKA